MVFRENKKIKMPKSSGILVVKKNKNKKQSSNRWSSSPLRGRRDLHRYGRTFWIPWPRKLGAPFAIRTPRFLLRRREPRPSPLSCHRGWGGKPKKKKMVRVTNILKKRNTPLRYKIFVKKAFYLFSTRTVHLPSEPDGGKQKKTGKKSQTLCCTNSNVFPKR